MPEHVPLPSQAISTGIAQLYKTRIGRGPTRVSTTIGPDLITCILGDTHTVEEATLVAGGASQLVRDARAHLQREHSPQAIAIVEEATGRTVAGHVPGYSVEHDLAVETFVLRPTGRDRDRHDH